MADTRHAKSNKFNRIAAGVLLIIVSLFCFLSLVGALGGVGEMVYGFLAGFFGLAAYAYALMGLIIGIAVTFNISVKIKPSRAITYFILLIVGILALNIYTSSGHIVGASYKDYLLRCYDYTNTAGGMLFGIASYPLMKAITSVGALIVVCVAFFVLSLIFIYPAIKRNVTYTVASKRDRQRGKRTRYADVNKMEYAETYAYDTPKKQSRFKKASVGTHPIEGVYMPTITDFNQQTMDGNGLYVVDIEGDPMPLKKSKRQKGADGYQPLGSFNPLYPNQQGGVEDEQRIKPQYTEESFSSRKIAKDILFGEGPSNDNLSRFTSANNPRNALNNVSPTYSAVRRTELRSKLGIDVTSDDEIKQDFMSRYRAYQPDQPQKSAVREVLNDKAGNSIENNGDEDRPIDFKRDFNALKQEQIQRFGERYLKPEFEAVPHSAQQDEVCLEAENVKKEVVKPSKTHGDVINSTIEKAQDSIKSQVNIGMLGALNRAISGEPEKVEKPTKQEIEMTAQAYDVPRTNRVQQEVVGDKEVQSVKRVQQPIGAKQPANVEDLERSGYSPVQGEKKIPRAFAQTAVEPVVNEPSKTDRPQYKPYEMPSTKDYNAKKDYSNAFGNSSDEVGDIPSEPAPIQQSISGRDMSRTAIQGATAIAKQSAKNKESAEVDARIKNIRAAIKEAPKVGQYEREALMREEKMRAAEGRGIQKAERNARKLDNIDTSKQRVTQVNMEQAIAQATPKRPYVAPPISLLQAPAPEVDQNEDYEQKKEQIINTLAFFSISAEVISIMVGPTFTMYKLRVEMPRGRTINYISTLESDIAMKMEAGSVRIIAPIPGENAVGIEVPNKHRRNVNLSEIIQSPEFNTAKAPATFALGKNLYGKSRVVQVSKLPHVLIAGATGAGKSCCINSVIVSLLYKASPDDVRLILIDPKRIEMSVYAGIPHLLMDEIICDTDKAIRALNWAITEMERRIKYLAEVGYRDIDEYNADCSKHNYDKMPRIVIIVDEFADLMSTGKRAVEDTVNRIARLARAVGIHLVLATQRPSVDVISGTIKNNFPSRVAFKVTSGFDSKTILDSIGAEKLLGYGDLLYMMPGSSELERMQGAFISNEEVKAVVDFVKAKNDAFFDNNIKDAIFKDKEEETTPQKGNANAKANDNKLSSDLFDALRLGIELREEQNAPLSISFMQRRLGFGWPKAAKIYDTMDQLGYLTPDEHDPKKKKVNISYEDLDALQQENGDIQE